VGLTKFVVLDQGHFSHGHFSFIFLFGKGSDIPQHIIAYSISEGLFVAFEVGSFEEKTFFDGLNHGFDL